MKKIFEAIEEGFIIILACAFLLAILGGGMYLHWIAYHYRFPNAPFWTMFFNR